MPDIHGRVYAKLSELKPGMIVSVDNGFDCMKGGDKFIVEAATDGSLFIKCGSEGGHTLDGQLADENDNDHDPDELIGIYLETTK